MKLDTRPPTKGDTVDGRYRLLDKLGQGAAGAVWRATQISVDRVVAIKFLSDPHRDQFAARFATEATAIAQLNHPNCVTLFDYGYSVRHGTFFIVLELVEGRPMVEALRDKSLSLPDRVRIVCDVARALNHAHDQGILHRDLKPENVCLARGEGGKEVVKVLDFGLARIVDRATSDDSNPQIPTRGRRGRRITAHGEAYGTPAFMSPEQCLGNLDVGPPSDVYSLGVMFAEFVQGRLPFRGATIRDLLQNHVHGAPSIDDSVPLPLQALLHRMLAKDPKNRPVPREVVERLQEWLASESSEELEPVPGFRTQTTSGPTLIGMAPVDYTPDFIEPRPGSLGRFSAIVPPVRSRQVAVAFVAATVVMALVGLFAATDDAVAHAPDVRPAARYFAPLVDSHRSAQADGKVPVLAESASETAVGSARQLLEAEAVEPPAVDLGESGAKGAKAATTRSARNRGERRRKSPDVRPQPRSTSFEEIRLKL